MLSPAAVTLEPKQSVMIELNDYLDNPEAHYRLLVTVRIGSILDAEASHLNTR